MDDNESDYSLGRRLICVLLSSPKLALRRHCIKKDSDLVDEVEVGLKHFIPMRVLGIVTPVSVWVSGLNW